MISAKNTFELAQDRNRTCFMNLAAEKLGVIITKAAKKGLRSIKYNYQELLIGAENLNEAAELFVLLGKILEKEGYSHSITEDGNLIISW